MCLSLDDENKPIAEDDPNSSSEDDQTLAARFQTKFWSQRSGPSTAECPDGSSGSSGQDAESPHLKFFAWLLIVDRLNTKDIMRRRNFHVQSGPICVLCNDDVEEGRDHLFFNCRFSKDCWSKLHIQWDMSLDIHNRIRSARNSSGHIFFMDIFIMAASELKNQ